MTEHFSDAAGARPWNAVDSGVIRHAIDPSLLGHAEISPKGEFEAGSYASFTLVYTAGKFGVDDSGSLRIVFRFASDQGNPQFDDPSGANYCTVEASNGAVLQLRWDPKGNVRPWDRTLWIKVVKGFLQEGDTITIRFGVTDHGGPGMRLQTFCEETFEFRVLVDPIATFNFQPLPVQPAIAIVPGKPERFVAALPTLKRPGEPFDLKLKGEDGWGNPSDTCSGRFLLEADGAIDGLPDSVEMKPGAFSLTVPGLTVSAPGKVSVAVRSEEGALVARTNPLIVEDRELVHFWADMHGQSEETIGTGSATEYFAFARDRAWVDACGHQGNDFQISDEFWAELNRITAEFDADGRFVAMPGYEWSGNTSLGGDRNVYFPTEGRTIRRSSHALIEDKTTADTDCFTAKDLFAAFSDEGESDVVCYAHCGGRYADIGFAHDGRFEKSVEVHSSWGSFEWLLHDAFKLGYRVGVVCNSDGHKGRPGASYPGAGKFGAIGGLTCFNASELSRPALLDCMRKRHHYGTTGGPNGRIAIDLSAHFESQAEIYHDDPALGPSQALSGTSAMMGDIVKLPQGDAELAVTVDAASPIERIDVFNGLALVETIRPFGEDDLGARIRLHWEGAEYRGRFREVIWDGGAELTGNTIAHATPINFFNRDKTLDQVGDDRVAWKALTTGNFGGADLRLSDPQAGSISVSTPLVSFDMPIAEIGYEDVVHDASGELPRFFKLFRLPDDNPHLSMSVRRRVSIDAGKDNPIYVRVTLEDGTRAWTSPIYIFR
ncbi:DUF3604 domain-containing protein [Oricola sp.]|uniref:DUF3604 domain-containing protein n=1 Tax=Oricola sp. TaxID=1979950 RepID=UPI0025E85B24|nr:DUF3604 domain-containing protein [Oricola sp.]MCI5078114.1 DUF3604 domain-containing protein [Oricola sp.]